MDKAKLLDETARRLTKEMADKGKLVEAGFVIFAHLVIPKDAPPIQITDMRLAFMAGAEHLFSSIMSVMDDDREPTADDMRRMDLIHKELENWRGTIAERVQPSKGRA